MSPAAPTALGGGGLGGAGFLVVRREVCAVETEKDEAARTRNKTDANSRSGRKLLLQAARIIGPQLKFVAFRGGLNQFQVKIIHH